VLTELSAAELAAKLRSRELSAREVTQAHLDRIAAQDAKYGCFLKVDEARALQGADEAQALLDKDAGGALTGVPIAVKDNISTEGIETTCASKILKGYVPPFDATVTARLKAAGMPILGKTNLDEFAMGTSTENSAFQLTRNPWDTQRSPGGSSGGSVASVAAELAPLSLGSDTGGSIRQPASLCGIVGFKPTYGRCSRYGLIAFGSSLDQIGPFARSVEDAALISSVITGHDPLDSTSLNRPSVAVPDFKSASLKGKRLALPKQLFGEGVSEGVQSVVSKALDRLREEGAIVEEVSIPTVSVGVTTYYIIAPAEASSNLARFDGVRFGPRAEGKGHVHTVERTRAEGFGKEVKVRIMIGTYALSAGYYDAFYLKAQTVRAMMAAEFEQVYSEYDFVVSPTSPVVAFKIGELTDDPLQLKVLDLCTIPANMNGMPAISLNCGFSEGLPVGLQLMAPPGADELLLAAAYATERALPEARKRPPLG
jgi:aspartyl-tRNA(Asn)/glutamyl-tRNA(Gln) amidotransferase subunit A